MKSINESFSELKEKRPLWSDYLCLSNAVLKKGFSFDQIRSAFDSLVGRQEYSLSDREEILQDLYQKTPLGHV